MLDIAFNVNELKHFAQLEKHAEYCKRDLLLGKFVINHLVIFKMSLQDFDNFVKIDKLTSNGQIISEDLEVGRYANGLLILCFDQGQTNITASNTVPSSIKF